MSTIINLNEHKDYTTYDGDGAAACLNFDGYVKCKIKRFKEVKTKDNQNDLVRLTLRLSEEDLPPHTLYAQAMTSGRDRNGDSMARQFLDVVTSAGLYSAEDIQKGAAANDTLSVADILNQIISAEKEVFVEVKAEAYKGKVSSKVVNFVVQAIYEREAAAGTHRRPNNLQAAGTTNGSNAKTASSLLQGVI